MVKYPWTKSALEDIIIKSITGEPCLKGRGFSREGPSLNDIVILPAQLHPIIPKDKHIESIDSEVIIGEGRDVLNPLILPSPILLNPFRHVNKQVRLAIAYGAGFEKVPINLGNTTPLPDEANLMDKLKSRFIIQWTPSRYELDLKALKRCSAIEILIGHGAKPSVGMTLSLEGITRRISESKTDVVEVDEIGPGYHLDMASDKDLEKHVELLKEATNYRIPILVRLAGGQVLNEVKLAVEAGADAIIVEGGEAGAGLAPRVTREHVGLPLLAIFSSALKAFKDTDAKKKGIKLFVSGGIRNGADVVKTLALGADGVCIGTSALVTFGCVCCGLCYKGKCEKGIATEDPNLMKRFNWKIAGKRLANYLKATRDEIEILVALTGSDDAKLLSHENIRAVTYDAAAVTGLKLMGYEKELPMWFH